MFDSHAQKEDEGQSIKRTNRVSHPRAEFGKV